MTPSQTMLMILVLGLTLISVVTAVIWGTVFLVRSISEALSTTLNTSYQTASSPGDVTQPTPTWQTVTTVPWEDWEMPTDEVQ